MDQVLEGRGRGAVQIACSQEAVHTAGGTLLDKDGQIRGQRGAQKGEEG